MGFIRRFQKDCSGASAIEYGVALALLGLMVLGGMSYFGLRMQAMLDLISGKLA